MASGPALLRRFTHGRGLGALVVARILAGNWRHLLRLANPSSLGAGHAD
jgi:hypothetical protein